MRHATPRSAPRRPLSLRASGDRWLFGYADIVTLLFACFATLYAARVEPVTAAAPPPAAPAPSLEPAATPRVDVAAMDDNRPDVTTITADLAELLKPAENRPAIDIADSARGVVISLPEAGSFPAGRADLTEAARGIMHAIAGTVRALPNTIRVEGHTDDLPIRTPLFASNWELSTARATRVVQFLIEQGGLAPERLTAAGYAEYRPRVPNDSVANRARNRRVDVVVVDLAAARREEPGR